MSQLVSVEQGAGVGTGRSLPLSVGGTNPQQAVAEQSPPAVVHKSAPMVPVDSQIDAYLKAHNQSVRFQVDAKTGMTIVNIYNEATGEVIQQIPNEVVVRIAQLLTSKCTANSPAVDVRA
jgi:uncharacterized FlaG/YvyC family protein